MFSINPATRRFAEFASSCHIHVRVSDPEVFADDLEDQVVEEQASAPQAGAEEEQES